MTRVDAGTPISSPCPSIWLDMEIYPSASAYKQLRGTRSDEYKVLKWVHCQYCSNDTHHLGLCAPTLDQAYHGPSFNANFYRAE